MPLLFAILLKINLVLMLFAVTYYLVLRKLTFYTINRVFLVFGILFSTIYPFINLTDFFYRQHQFNGKIVAFVPQLNEQATKMLPTDLISDYWNLISFVFFAGVVIMALRLISQFFSLYLMYRKSKPGVVNNMSVRILNESVSPFSFWQTIYINPKLHAENELKTILAHEQIHVKEWHSLDIIVAELSVVFYWFNPGIWLMKKAVKENLEFITDQKILNKGVDRKSYQYSLLEAGNLGSAVEIVSHFNIYDLKKRIEMMNTKRSSKMTLSRYLFITPILLMITLAFTVSKKEIKTQLTPLTEVLSPAFEAVNALLPVKDSNSKTSINQRKIKANLPTTALQKNEDLSNAILFKRDTTAEQASSVEKQSKLQIYIRHLDLQTDSSSSPVARVRSFKVLGLPKSETGSNLVNSKDTSANDIAMVKGYTVKAKNGTFEGGRYLILKSQRPPDTAIFGKSQIYINGKLTKSAELAKINPSEISSIEIFKEKPKVEMIVVKRQSP